MAAGSVHIPWYATLFRADRFAEALEEIAPLAIRYGAKSYAVYRSRDDFYKFVHTVEFDEKLQWERYWNGPEFSDWRATDTSRAPAPGRYLCAHPGAHR